MRIVYDRAEARWLPSRAGFALARLIAFVMLRRAHPQAAPGLRLIVQREQIALEQYAVSVWVLLTTIAYLTATLTRWMVLPAAAAVAIVSAAFIVEIPYLLLGALLLPFRAGNRKLLSTACMILLLLASSYFATRATPVRFVAYFALLLFALNAVAAVVMFALRGPVRRLEERCGV